MRGKKKGKLKRCGISKNETLFLFVKEKIPLHIVLSRNNRNFLPDALKFGKIFLVYLFFRRNFMKACDIIQILSKVYGFKPFMTF